MLEDCSRSVKIDSNIEVSVSSSIGISIYPDNGDNKIQLLELADSAMYKAKSEKNMNYFYST